MFFNKPQDINKSFIVNYAPIFASLNKGEKNLILKRSEIKHYKKGEVIYRQGDPPDAFYCVISGRVRTFRSGERKDDTLEFLICGMYFGIISLLTTEKHSISAEAVNDSLILTIKKEDFDFILRKIPKLAIDLSKTLSEQIRRRDFEHKPFKSNIISIYSAVKGMGRTMYAINLSLSLRKETKKKVIFLEISESGRDIIRALEMENSKEPIGLNNSILQRDHLDKFIINNPTLDIDFLNIEYRAEHSNSDVQISSLFTLLTNDYQYIIVDLPFERSEVVFKALTQSDAIHVITDYDPDNLKSTRELIGDLVHNVEYPQEKIKVILNEKKDSKKIPFDEVINIIGHDVFANIPVFWQASDALNKESATIVLRQPNSEYTRAIRRIARQIGDILVGLALGGGAAFGLAHIGVIKVLERENIPIDIVSGSSMGALVGAFWAAGKDSKELENVMMRYDNNKIKVINLLIDPCFPKTSLAKGNRIARFLKEELGDKTFADTKLPIKIIGCNLDIRKKIVFDSGSLVDAVRCSIAVPGVFSPIVSDGNLIIDGGILEPVPTHALKSAGVKKIIAVNVLPSPEEVREGYINYKYYLEKERADAMKRNIIHRILYRLRVLFRKLLFPNILDIMVNSLQAMEYMIARQDCKEADIVINPVVIGANWFEFFRVAELVKKGETETEKVIGKIKELVNA